MSTNTTDISVSSFLLTVINRLEAELCVWCVTTLVRCLWHVFNIVLASGCAFLSYAMTELWD